MQHQWTSYAEVMINDNNNYGDGNDGSVDDVDGGDLARCPTREIKRSDVLVAKTCQPCKPVGAIFPGWC